LRLEYDQLPKLFSDSYQTPFTNPGSTNLTLPTGFVRGAATTGMTTLNSSMRPFNVESTRNALTLGVGKKLPAGWDVDLRVKREKRDGNRFTAGVIGNSGGNPRAAILPEPIDYTTDEIEALARYTSKKLQMQFGYFGSFFSNANNGLTWANPFASSVWVAGTTPGVSAYNSGQLGLPPDNQMHQLSASAGYTLTSDTRLSGSLSVGRMTQNDAFLPYTINPGLAATVTTPLPRSSLDGRIDTTHFDMKLNSKLMPKLNFSALYRYDERDNKTPQAQYWYLGGDSQGQAAAGLGKIRTNLPGSSTKQQVDAEFDYHYSTNTKLKFGYGYDWAKKTYEAIEDEREHTVKAEVHQHFSDMVSGGLGYAWSDRKTSTYNAGAPFVASFSSAYIATQVATGVWDNVPTQKKFFMAPRTRDKVRAFVNVAPTDRVDLQAGFDYKFDDYHDSPYGLQTAKGWALNLDATFTASDTLSGHVFTSLDSYKTGQRSIALGGAKTNVTNTALDWTADISDRTFTVGAGVRYKPQSKYQLGADVMHANSTGKVGVWTGSGIAAASQATPFPDLRTKLARLDMFSQYEMKKDVSIKVKYIFEHYDSADWSVDQVLPATMANVIGTNQVSPKYNVHFIGVSVAYQF
jgi:MtrB/PioB family decaheme-associated outer membrane protein